VTKPTKSGQREHAATATRLQMPRPATLLFISRKSDPKGIRTPVLTMKT
jgi:hypothetical protein